DRLVGLDVAGHVGRPVLERVAGVAGHCDRARVEGGGAPVQLVVGLVDPGAGRRAGRGARVAGAQGDVDGAAVPEAVVVVARGRVDGVHEHGDRLVGLDVAGHVGRPVLERVAAVAGHGDRARVEGGGAPVQLVVGLVDPGA